MSGSREAIEEHVRAYFAEKLRLTPEAFDPELELSSYGLRTIAAMDSGRCARLRLG